MSTVAVQPATRKPAKAFHAHLFMDPGVLTKIGGTLVFVREADYAIIAVEPQHCMFLTVLGEVGVADAQHVEDLMRGGPAGVACSRAQEVR